MKFIGGLDRCLICDTHRDHHADKIFDSIIGLHEFCQRKAPWSYRELVTWIGLEALYQTYVNTCSKQHSPPYFRHEWIKLPALIAVTPDAIIEILRAGLALNTTQSFLLGPGPQPSEIN